MRHPRFTVPALALALVSALAGPALASVSPPVGSVVHGADVSWPNCPVGMGIPERRTLGLPMPDATAKFVILGLTNGPAFTPNPCLASQVAFVKQRHLWLGAYAITSYPTPAQLAAYGGPGASLSARLYQTGAAQARFNIATMQRTGITVPMLWMDVENVAGRPWNANPAANQAVVAGAVWQYLSAGYKLGLYSYNGGWTQIMGTKRYPNTPTWVPSGKATAASASAKCSAPSFSGGPVWLGQWTTGGQDFDLTCPGVTGGGPALSPLTPYVNVTLQKGSRGAAVVALQRRLALEADGVFGLATQAKVMAVQRSLRVTPTGVVTAPLWRALGAGTMTAERASTFAKLFTST